MMELLFDNPKSNPNIKLNIFSYFALVPTTKFRDSYWYNENALFQIYSFNIYL